MNDNFHPLKHQKEPENWKTWAVFGGRGSGKTKLILEIIKKYREKSILLMCDQYDYEKIEAELEPIDIFVEFLATGEDPRRYTYLRERVQCYDFIIFENLRAINLKNYQEVIEILKPRRSLVTVKEDSRFEILSLIEYFTSIHASVTIAKPAFDANQQL